MKESAAKRESPGDFQKVSFESSAENKSVHVKKKKKSDSGKELPERTR